MGALVRDEEKRSSSGEEEEEDEDGAKLVGLTPGTGIFGVLKPDAPKKSPNAGHAAPQMKIELLERKTTGCMLIAIWTAFFVCISYFFSAGSTRTDRFKMPPPATAAASWEVPAEDLVGVANYLPYTGAAGNNVFDFRAAVTVLPPDISVTDSEGANLTALQWFGANAAGETADRGIVWRWYVEYRDDTGIKLSGEDVRFEILAYVCWSDCEVIGNWHAVFPDDTPAFSRKIDVRQTNADGEPAVIRWDVVAYSEYTPSHENVCFSVRYTNDPGNATAGYKVFEENSNGQFGSCGSGDADGSDSSDSNPDDSCMRLTQKSQVNGDYGRRGLALVAFVITAVCTVAWVIIIYRAPPRGWLFWNLQQKWTLVMAIGTVLYQNPIQTIWTYFESLENNPGVNRAMESITFAGITIILLVAVFWADSARYRVLSSSQFYVSKIGYAVSVYVAVCLGLRAIYPTGQSGGDFWAASTWSWPEDRSALFVVAEAVRLLLWLLGGLFYYYYLHCSFKFYNKMPYMLTRAEQLSFRFVVSTFSLFVMLAVFNVAARFFIAVNVITKDSNGEASTMTRSAVFFEFLYGDSIRSPVTMAFMTVAVLVFQFAFMPASALQLIKYKPKYVRLESDILRQAWRRQARSFQRQHDNVAQGAAGAALGAAAAAVNLAQEAATAGHEAAATAAAATAAATMGAVDVVDAVAATPGRPVFVIERARWLASISREAYRCFTDEELAVRGVNATEERLVEVATLGCEVVAKLEEPEDNNLHDTHCLIVRHRLTRRLIVAFRGTISKKQMKTDLQATRCAINLDLFALRAPKKSCFRVSGEATAQQPEVPEGHLQQRAVSEGGSSTQAPTRGLQGSASSAGRRAAKKEKLRAHMAAEDNMPQFLLSLASVLQEDAQAAGRSLAEKAGAKVLDAESSAATAAAGGGGARPQAGPSLPKDAPEATGAPSAGGAEYDVATPFEEEEGRRPSHIEPEEGSTAFLKEKGPAVRARPAVASVVEGAARGLRERAAGMHARRLAARQAKALRGKVHHGFWSSYSTVRERVLTIVQRELLREPGQLYVTGHSLGGALATMCAYDMALWLLPIVNARLGREPDSTGEENEEEITCTMYNFGSPRVGNAFFAKRYNSLVPHSYRVVCDGDLVTGVPPKRLGYTHVGCSAVVDRTGCGSLLIDPSVLEARFKTRRTLNVAAHLFGPYMAALDGCLYPLETKEEIVALINAVYRNRSGGEWYGCACFWLCCDARLPRWLGCDSCGKGATAAVGQQEGESDTDSDADDMDTLVEKEPQSAGALRVAAEDSLA